MMNPSETVPNLDTYEILEFQGFVADVPTYDKDTGKLEFVARALNRPTLKFTAQGETALGFKSILHKGCMVQLQAVPFPHLETVGREKCRVIDWEVRKMAVLGVRKTNLGKFSDVRILDGLMPTESDLEDVGYVDPELSDKDKIRDKYADELLKARKEISERGNGNG